MTQIARTFFSTDAIESQERFDLWRESIAVLFQIDLPDKQKSSKNFFASLEAYMLAELMVVRTNSSAAHYDRLAKHINSDGIDTVMIQLMLAGDIFFDHGKGQNHAQVGDLIVFDLGQALQNFNTDYHHISLLFPRDLIEDYVPLISNWHGQLLPRDSVGTKLLKNHLLSVMQLLPTLKADEIEIMQRSLLDMTSLAFSPNAVLPKNVSEAVDASLLVSIKRFIRSQLKNYNLGTKNICAEFNLSRTQLYRITSPLGGLKQFIRQLRLSRCLRDLRDPRLSHISISEIAYNWGFNDLSTFNRNFKAIYNQQPKDARQAPNFSNNTPILEQSDTDLDRSYEEWVRSLS